MALLFNSFVKKKEPAANREEALSKRQDALINYLESNEDQLRLFDSLDKTGKDEYTNTFYEVYADEGMATFMALPNHLVFKQDGTDDPIGSSPMDWVDKTEDRRKYGFGLKKRKIKELPLYDTGIERLYDAVDKGDVELSELDEGSLAVIGGILHQRGSDKADEAKVQARKALDNMIQSHEELGPQYFADPETWQMQVYEGVTRPFSDFGVWLAGKIKGDDEIAETRNKATALEHVAYPQNRTWENVGEVAGLFGGSVGLYQGLAKKGLSQVIKAGAQGGWKVSAAALGATSAGEFALGAAYGTPTFVLSPENPNRVMSGLEAMLLGNVFNLATDSYRTFKGMKKADVVQQLDELKPDGWTEVREGIMSKYKDVSPENAALAKQFQDRPPTSEAKSAMSGRNLADDYRQAEAAQQRLLQEQQPKPADITPSKVEGLQEAMQARQIQEPTSTPVSQGDSAAVTPEYARNVEIEDRLTELRDRTAVIQQRRGASKKERNRIRDEVTQLKQEQLLNNTGDKLTKYERMAEEAYPGSVLGINAYTGDFQELRKLATRELGLRTGMGYLGAQSAEENDGNPFTGFLLGFMMPVPRGALVDKMGKAKGLLPSLKPFDYLIKPHDQRIKDISPLAWNDVQGVARRNLEDASNYIHRANPFFETLDALWKSKIISQDDLNEIVVALHRGDRQRLYAAFNRATPSQGGQAGALQQAHKEVEDVLDDLLLNAQYAGVDIKHRPNYFPTKVKDLELLRKIRGYTEDDVFKAAVDEFEQQIGARATQAEKMEIYSEVVRQQERSSPSYMNRRKIDDFDVDDMPAYENIRDAFSQYVGSVVERTNMNTFLGKSADNVPPQVYGRIIEKSIGSSIDEMLEKMSAQGLVPDPADMRKLKNLLNDFAVNSGRTGLDALSAYKNLFYATTIGNPISTLSQIPDLAIMASKDPTAFGTALKDAIRNRKLEFGFDRYGKDRIAADILTTGDGLREGIKDLKGNPKSAKKWNRFSQVLLNKSLKWAGFRKLDMAMKSLGTNTHYTRLRKWANAPDGSKLRNKLERKQKEIFGEKYDDLVAALQRGDVDDPLVSQAVFNEITQIHPLNSVHMPTAYLKNPNLRFTYALKSFMLRHINFMRSELIADIRKAKSPGEFAEAVGTYGTYIALFAGTNMGTTALQDFILGRDVTLSDRAVKSMTQTLTGINRFQIYQSKNMFDTDNPYQQKMRVGSFALDLLVPHQLITYPAADIAGLHMGERNRIEDWHSTQLTPVAGKNLYWQLGMGKEKEAQKKADRLHKLKKLRSGKFNIQVVE